MDYKVSLSAINIPDDVYPILYDALRDRKIGQTELISEFEAAIARYVGTKYCIAISNGTMADAVAVAAMKAFWPELVRVVVPALTFIAQPNSVRYNGLEVKFVDVGEDWLLDPTKIDLFSSDQIVFTTDLMGRQATGPYDIEDACEAFGTRFGGSFAGTWSNLGTYSFFPSHTISTGEGGAIVTDDENLDRLCRSIRAHGSVSSDPMEKFHFPNFGFNARITSLQATLGIALMKHIDEYVEKRRRNFLDLRFMLGGFEERPREEIVPHGYPVEFESETARDAAMRNILAAGIECRKFFSCIPLEEKQYLQKGSFPVAEHIAHTHLYVPCHQNMTKEDVKYVGEIVLAQVGRRSHMPVDQNSQSAESQDQGNGKREIRCQEPSQNQ